MKNLTRIPGNFSTAETPVHGVLKGYDTYKSGRINRRSDKNLKSIGGDRFSASTFAFRTVSRNKRQNPVGILNFYPSEVNAYRFKNLKGVPKQYRSSPERFVSTTTSSLLIKQLSYGTAILNQDFTAALSSPSSQVSTDGNSLRPDGSPAAESAFASGRNNTNTTGRLWYRGTEPSLSYSILHRHDQYPYRGIFNISEETQSKKNISEGRSFRIVWVKTDHSEGVNVAYSNQVIWYFKIPRLSFTT